MAEQLNFQINIGGQERIVNSFREMRQALKDAEFEALKLSSTLGEADPKVVQLREDIGRLKEQIKDSAEATANFAKGAGIFPAISKSIVGLSSAYTAVQGAIGILGLESKDLEKQLLRVQSALAFSQGLTGLLEAKDAFINLGAQIKGLTIVQKANTAANATAAAVMRALGLSVDTTSASFRFLKTAIASTGVLVFVVAIGELISALDNYLSTAERAKAFQDSLNEGIKKGAEISLSSELEAINRTEQLLKAESKLRGDNAEEIYNIEQESRRLRIKARERYQKEIEKLDANAGVKNAQEIKKEQNDIRVSEINFQIEQKKRKKETDEELLKKTKERLLEELRLQKEQADRETAAQKIIIEAYRNLQSDRQKDLLNAEQEFEDKKGELIKAGFTDFTILEEEYRKIILEINKKYDKEEEENKKEKDDKERDRIANNNERIVETARVNARTLQERQDAEYFALEEQYRVERELAIKNNEDLLALDELYLAQFNAVKLKYNEERYAAIIQSVQQVKDSFSNVIIEAGKTIDFQQQLLKQNLESGLISQEQFNEKSAVLAKQKAIQDRNLALFNIAIDTGVAIAGIVRQVSTNPLNLTGVNYFLDLTTRSAAVIANMLKARNAIKQATVTSSDSNISVSKGFGATSPVIPSSGQVLTTNISSALINALGNAAIKAYVVETDITTNQKRIAAIKQRARFG